MSPVVDRGSIGPTGGIGDPAIMGEGGWGNPGFPLLARGTDQRSEQSPKSWAVKNIYNIKVKTPCEVLIV